MPICEIDPWRLQYFASVRCPADVRIPTEDSDAWTWNPRHRWVYDRIAVAQSQGIDAGPHGTVPPGFPVFSKPIVNLKGMGLGTRVLRSPDDYDLHCTAGHMWMTLLAGRHVSSDAAVVSGKPRWWRHVTGLPAGGGTFDYWTDPRERRTRARRLRSVAGLRRILATTRGWSISRRSAARSSKFICAQPISGPISTGADGSMRSCTSIRAASGHSPIGTVATATASCCSTGPMCAGDILTRDRSRTSGRLRACRASRSRSTRIAILRCMRCLPEGSASRSSTAGTWTSALPRAIGSACTSSGRASRGMSRRRRHGQVPHVAPSGALHRPSLVPASLP